MGGSQGSCACGWVLFGFCFPPVACIQHLIVERCLFVGLLISHLDTAKREHLKSDRHVQGEKPRRTVRPLNFPKRNQWKPAAAAAHMGTRTTTPVEAVLTEAAAMPPSAALPLGNTQGTVLLLRSRSRAASTQPILSQHLAAGAVGVASSNDTHHHPSRPTKFSRAESRNGRSGAGMPCPEERRQPFFKCMARPPPPPRR